MKKINKGFIPVICMCFILTMLSGCKGQKEQETAIKVEDTVAVSTTETETESETEESHLTDEGDVVIVVPDDEEMGGE